MNHIKKHHVCAAVCALELLALLAAAERMETGSLPVWAFVPIAVLLLACAIVSYQLAAIWYLQERRRVREAERLTRLDRIREERREKERNDRHVC